MKKYEFEKILQTNPSDLAVVNAWRFATQLRRALGNLEWEARGYGYAEEDYFLDTKAFLENMLSRLEALPDKKE